MQVFSVGSSQFPSAPTDRLATKMYDVDQLAMRSLSMWTALATIAGIAGVRAIACSGTVRAIDTVLGSYKSLVVVTACRGRLCEPNADVCACLVEVWI